MIKKLISKLRSTLTPNEPAAEALPDPEAQAAPAPKAARRRARSSRSSTPPEGPHADAPQPRASAADGAAPHDNPSPARKRASRGKAVSDAPQTSATTADPQKRGPRKPRKKSPATPPPGEWDPAEFDVPVVTGQTRFHDLGLPAEILHAVADLDYRYCTPIQAAIMPSVLEGQDATGRAQTGTGKTAAFLISIFTRLIRMPLEKVPGNGTPRVLILAPTRELVLQIAAEAVAIARYVDMRIVTVFGGMDYEKQRRELTGHRTDVIVATPGRLLDFQRSRDLDLGSVEILVIDEADRMLDMGFIPDVRRIVHSTPAKAQRQTLLFSATLTEEVTRLTSQWTRKPVVVEIEPEQVAVDTVEQLVYIVTTDQKFSLLYNIITRQELNRVIVFCNRRDETVRLVERLQRYGLDAEMLTGQVAQKQRIKRLESFRSGNIRILVATDVAGRGIHIEKMSHVINYTLPRDPEDYVHRIGRTGRAGSSGTSISFADEEDSFYIPPIEKFIGQKLSCTQPADEWLNLPPALKRAPRRQSPTAPKGRPQRRSRRSSSAGRKPRRTTA